MLFFQKKFYLFQQVSLILILSNLLFSTFYLLGLPQGAEINWLELLTLPVIGVLLFYLASFMVVRPHLFTFPRSLVVAVLGKGYLDKLYQIVRKQILVVSFLLQILIAYTNWGNLNQAFLDPSSFTTYLFWILFSCVLVATFYFIYLLWREVFHLNLIK